MGILNMVYGSGGGGGAGYKSYSELKAMTQSNVLTELNTNALGYYNNLNGNGHIIGIGIANDDKTTYQCWGVSPIIYRNGAWRDGEIIIAKIKTDSSGNLMIPKAGYGTGTSQNASYNWWVSYDGGSETQYSGTGSAGSITIASGLTADTEHTVVIRPNSEDYLWARAFGFRNSGVETLLTEIVYDSSYVGYSTSELTTGNRFRHSQYYGCTSLTIAPIEVLPNTVTSIDGYFRHFQYRSCTSLTTASKEVMPNSVTSIGVDFRYTQYRDCTSLTTAPQEVMSNSVTSVGIEFRYAQYYGCTSLTTASQEVFPDTVTSIGNSFRYSQYNGCTSLTIAPSEVLPDTVTSIGVGFRRNQYNGCSSLKEIQGIKDLSVGNSNYRNSQFNNCTSNKTVKVLSNVGYEWYDTTLSDTYVSVVLVPSAYLQNYIDATTNPRSSITDSKFVGY